MAVYAWLYRKRRACFLLLCVTTFWIVYLFLSLSPTGKHEHQLPPHTSLGSEVTRQFSVSMQTPPKTRADNPDKTADDKAQRDKGGNGKVGADNSVEDGKLVMEPPQPVEEANQPRVEQSAVTQNNGSLLQQGVKVEAAVSTTTTKTPESNATAANTTTALKPKEVGGLGKLKELGEKLRNKTIEVGQKVKNKTFAVFGIGEKQAEKPTATAVLFHPNHWNLSVSFEDIGNIMKDTAFLHRRSPLDLHAPVLMSTQNRTANYTLRLKSHQGYCDCWERHCVCCARLVQLRLHINNTLCSNFTFLSKSQEFDLVISADSKPIDKTVIPAHTPPVVCVGSSPKVADICMRFFNMTFKVNPMGEHKTQLLGCTDLSLNLYNKTLALVPIDCFQIPGDPNHQHADRPSFNEWPNFVP